MREYKLSYLLLLVLLILSTTYLPIQAQILELGQAVVTCSSEDPAGPVVGIIDVRDRTGVAKGLNWEAPMYKHPSWTREQLGNVFGVAIRNNGDIYITATDHYGPAGSYGPGGAGGIYRIDGMTGEWELFKSLALLTGESLGNIAYDQVNDQFFVTTRKLDGFIYRIDANTGETLSSIEITGQRTWGIAVDRGKIYYGVMNSVYSMELMNGDFNEDPAATRLEATIESPATVIADIEVGNDGSLLVAQVGTHNAGVHRLVPTATGWTQVQIPIGNYQVGNNAAGGVDYGYDSFSGTTLGEPEHWVLATGDALRFPSGNEDGISDFVYGMAGVPTIGTTIDNRKTIGYYVDFDGNLNSSAVKGDQGDVDVYRQIGVDSCIALVPEEGVEEEVCGTAFFCVDDDADLSYIRNGSEIWNSEVKLNFAEKFALNVPFERVEWYIKDNIKQQYRKVEDPTNFYFCAMGPDRDEWGLVTIQPFYQNSEGTLCMMDSTFLEVVDRGIYFRSADKKIQRWKEEVYEENPALYDGFFDPSKPTLIHVHGWQPGANKRHVETGSDERGRLIEGAENPEDVAKHWLNQGWNVAIYFWTQYAEYDDEGSNLNAYPEKSAENTYSASPQWYRTDGTMTTESGGTASIASDFVSKLINLRLTTSNTTEMRWAGHSLGSIAITQAAIEMRASGNVMHLPSRLVYLDPAWDPGFFGMWENSLLPAIDDYPVVEWYQTSPYNILFGQSAGGQLLGNLLSAPNYPNGNEIYNAAIQNSAYVRSHPLWQEGYPVGGGFLHASARRHYFSSFKDDRKPTVLERSPVDIRVFDTEGDQTIIPVCEVDALEPDNEYYNLFTLIDLFDSFESYISTISTRTTSCFYPTGTADGPSAKASVEELKKWRGYPLSQVRGMTTINTNDDGYGIQKLDTEFHRDRTVEAEDSLDAQRCNRVILGAGFHAKTGSWMLAKTEVNCQEAVCPANCTDPIFNDAIVLRKKTEESTASSSIAPSIIEAVEAETSTFKAYPNPTAEGLTLQIPKGYETVRIELYSIQGVKQLEQTTSADEGNVQVSLDLSSFPAGLYILTVHDAQGQHLYATRIVKE